MFWKVHVNWTSLFDVRYTSKTEFFYTIMVSHWVKAVDIEVIIQRIFRKSKLLLHDWYHEHIPYQVYKNGWGVPLRFRSLTANLI